MAVGVESVIVMLEACDVSLVNKTTVVVSTEDDVESETWVFIVIESVVESATGKVVSVVEADVKELTAG